MAGKTYPQFVQNKMKSIFSFESIYIHRGPVDMRKSINGLSVIVATEMNLDLKASALFIFSNKPRTHLKILYFDKSGFALWLKKLERGKFPWPRLEENAVISISAEDLEFILEGVNIWTRFKEVHFENII
jgi:transposase